MNYNPEGVTFIHKKTALEILGVLDRHLKTLVEKGLITKYELKPKNTDNSDFKHGLPNIRYSKEECEKFVLMYGYGDRYHKDLTKLMNTKTILGDYYKKYNKECGDKFKPLLNKLNASDKKQLESYCNGYQQYVLDMSDKLFDDTYNIMKYNIAANTAKLLEKVFIKTKGNRSEAALLLGISRWELERYIDMYRVNFVATLSKERAQMLECMTEEFVSDYIDVDLIRDGFEATKLLSDWDIVPYHTMGNKANK
jgi:DNA-binding protein Fis